MCKTGTGTWRLQTNKVIRELLTRLGTQSLDKPHHKEAHQDHCPFYSWTGNLMNLYRELAFDLCSFYIIPMMVSELWLEFMLHVYPLLIVPVYENSVKFLLLIILHMKELSWLMRSV